MTVAAALGLLLTLVTFATNFCTVQSEVSCAGIVPWRKRAETISIADFGGVGDGLTLNTWPFRKAVYRIEHLRRRGGTLLYVPPGVWLTGSFNLTSHMTLYLARGAVIKATKDTWSWPLVDPLPSYGRGRELPGGRYASLIQGNGLRDVIITGDKGVIDGQGEVWWNMWRRRSLRYTRPHLLEFMHSREILISNIVFKNSPFWNIHPVYCMRVVIRYGQLMQMTMMVPPTFNKGLQYLNKEDRLLRWIVRKYRSNVVYGSDKFDDEEGSDELRLFNYTKADSDDDDDDDEEEEQEIQ